MNAGKINIKAHKDVNNVINKDAINAVQNCLNPLNPVSNFPLLVLTTSIENIDNPKYKGPNNIKGPTNVIAETDKIIPKTNDNPKNVPTFPLI